MLRFNLEVASKETGRTVLKCSPKFRSIIILTKCEKRIHETRFVFKYHVTVSPRKHVACCKKNLLMSIHIFSENARSSKTQFS